MNEIETFFDTMAERWDTICAHDPERIRTILKQSGLLPEARILDVGCGTGVMEPFLLEYRPARVVGIDLSGRMIERARTKFHDHPEIEFHQADALTFRDRPFDYILLYSAYPHFLRPARLIGHLKDLLAPHGKLVICHSESRERINSHHESHARDLSLPLPPASEVAALMKPDFDIRAMADTDTLYLVCGERIS